MAWYWWIAIAAAIFLVARALIKAKSPRQDAEDEFRAHFAGIRQENADAESQLAKVTELISELPVMDAGTSAGGSTLARAGLAAAVSKFLKASVVSEWRSGTKMVHVVQAPGSVTIFSKLRPDKPQAAMRIVERVDENGWRVRTRQVEDMDIAITAAEEAAKR